MVKEIIEQFRKISRFTNVFFSFQAIKEKFERNEIELFATSTVHGFKMPSNYEFDYLFFSVSGKPEDFSLPMFKDEKDLVIELPIRVSKEKMWLPIFDRLRELGFENHMTLVRMSLVKKERKGGKVGENFESFLATKNDISQIKSLLELNFDKYGERIPNETELENLLSSTYCVKEKGLISAVLISEKKGNSEELKYWLVSEKNRGKGYGTKLMEIFLSRNSDTQIYYLWVEKNNFAAISKYVSFGFEMDSLKNLVFKRLNK